MDREREMWKGVTLLVVKKERKNYTQKREGNSPAVGVQYLNSESVDREREMWKGRKWCDPPSSSADFAAFRASQLQRLASRINTGLKDYQIQSEH